MNRKLAWSIVIALVLLALFFWRVPGAIKVFLAYSALAILCASVVVLIAGIVAWVMRRPPPWSAGLVALGKTRPVPVALAVVAALACVAGAVFVVYQAGQPVVACGSARGSPSAPPAAPVTAQDFFARGDYDYAQGDCDTAIADYGRAIELDPTFAQAYNNRAYVYMVKKDYASALTDLDRAIELRPDYVNALLNRGDIYNYYYSIDYARAVADYDRALQVDPGIAGRSSVCGHRMLALQRGWNLNVLGGILTNRVTAGCPGAAQ